MPYQQDKEASAKRWTWTVVFGTLVAGAVASLAAKTLFQINVSQSDCQHSFKKPFFLTCAMFVGEALCLVYYQLFVSPKTSFAARRHRAQASLIDAPVVGGALLDVPDEQNDQIDSPSINRGDQPVDLPSVPVWFFLILCTFDLTASTLNFIGLLWITASLNLMFRGSMSVFVALFSVCLLRRRLAVVQWVSVAIVVAGLATVGFSSYLKPKNPDDDDGNTATSGEVVIGVILTIASAILNSFQNVVEELLMKMLSNYAEPHPLEIVGWEGVFGTILSGFVMLPIVHSIGGDDCGRQEDAIDTLKQFQDPLVVLLVIAYVLGLALMNYFSMELSRLLSAVVRNLVSGVRTVLVWAISVILYYSVGKSYGEQIGLWSIVELCGFVLLIGGSVLYSKAKETQLPAKGDASLIDERSSETYDEAETDYQRMEGETNRAVYTS